MTVFNSSMYVLNNVLNNMTAVSDTYYNGVDAYITITVNDNGILCVYMYPRV